MCRNKRCMFVIVDSWKRVTSTDFQFRFTERKDCERFTIGNHAWLWPTRRYPNQVTRSNQVSRSEKLSCSSLWLIKTVTLYNYQSGFVNFHPVSRGLFLIRAKMRISLDVVFILVTITLITALPTGSKQSGYISIRNSGDVLTSCSIVYNLNNRRFDDESGTWIASSLIGWDFTNRNQENSCRSDCATFLPFKDV